MIPIQKKLSCHQGHTTGSQPTACKATMKLSAHALAYFPWHRCIKVTSMKGTCDSWRDQSFLIYDLILHRLTDNPQATPDHARANEDSCKGSCGLPMIYL